MPDSSAVTATVWTFVASCGIGGFETIAFSGVSFRGGARTARADFGAALGL
jgi:hypothetical protein